MYHWTSAERKAHKRAYKKATARLEQHKRADREYERTCDWAQDADMMIDDDLIRNSSITVLDPLRTIMPPAEPPTMTHENPL